MRHRRLKGMLRDVFNRLMHPYLLKGSMAGHHIIVCINFITCVFDQLMYENESVVLSTYLN